MTCSCEEKKVIIAPKAPKALGPYSAAIKIDHFIYCSGQTGLDPATNELVEGGIGSTNPSGVNQPEECFGSCRNRSGSCGKNNRFPEGYG